MTPLALAIQFLTVLPLRVKADVRDEDLARSMGFYPLVGGLMGAVSAGVYFLANKFIGTPAAVVSATASLAVLSGALHLEGFADLCDGFYAGRNKDEVLAIMKDSHAGPMAIVGLFLLLALKLAFLYGVPETSRMAALVLAPTLARWSMVYLCALSTYARAAGGTGSPYVGKVKAMDLAKAALFAFLISWGACKRAGVLIFAGGTVFAWIFKRWVYGRIDGMTGDALGACGELVEAGVLAFLAIK